MLPGTRLRAFLSKPGAAGSFMVVVRTDRRAEPPPALLCAHTDEYLALLRPNQRDGGAPGMPAFAVRWYGRACREGSDAPGAMTAASLPVRAAVLVVDDDSVVRGIVRQALTRADFGEVTEASSGAEALDLIERTRFAVVLLDNQMPGMSGLDVLRQLRNNARTATLPVILVTGQAEMDDRIRGLDAGANDYLAKPVDLRELVARVRSQLRVRGAWAELVEANLRRRAAMAEALSRIRPMDDATQTAHAICQELADLWKVTGAAVLAFSGAGAVIPLAASGSMPSRITVGRPLHPADAAFLVERARIGPWIDEGGLGSRPPAAPPAGPASGRPGEATVHVPLGTPERRLGLLMARLATAGGDGSNDHAAETLSAAIDVAGIVTALLGPLLEERAEIEDLVTRVQAVLDAQAFFPVFQPVVDLVDGQAVGFEALTRFEDGTRPDVKLAEAARAGMNVEMEVALLRAALHSATELPAGAWLSMNVSPPLLSHTDGLRGVLEQRGERRVVLELTEHEPVANYEEVRGAVRSLGPGIRLAVDDAGAGYASLRHVLALQPSFVKLDREWVRDLDSDRARQALVAGLAFFASRSDCQLIAEGIETEAERATVLQLGINLAQGYLLGRPAPLDGHARGGKAIA